MLTSLWIRFWMKFAGLNSFGRIATRMVSWFAAPYYERTQLARLNEKGFVAPSATLHHRKLRLGKNVLINDRVLIYEDNKGGTVEIGDGVHLHNDITIQTGQGGSVIIAANTHIQPRCQFSAYKASIQIGKRCEIAPNCAFYPYDHGMLPDEIIRKQPLTTKGGIVVEDDVWIGFGVIVLDGVRIGKGAVVGAGAVVTRDIPTGGIAFGVPARLIKNRQDLANGEHLRTKVLYSI